MLSEPFQGDVSKPGTVRSWSDYEEGDQVDLIVFHVLSPPQVNCRNMIQQLGFVPIKGFAYNGKWMDLQGPAPVSGDSE